MVLCAGACGCDERELPFMNDCDESGGAGGVAAGSGGAGGFTTASNSGGGLIAGEGGDVGGTTSGSSSSGDGGSTAVSSGTTGGEGLGGVNDSGTAGGDGITDGGGGAGDGGGGVSDGGTTCHPGPAVCEVDIPGAGCAAPDGCGGQIDCRAACGAIDFMDCIDGACVCPAFFGFEPGFDPPLDEYCSSIIPGGSVRDCGGASPGKIYPSCVRVGGDLPLYCCPWPKNYP